MTNPFIPPEKDVTPRESLLRTLSSEPLTARELSQLIGISEKDVLHHLEHLQKTLKTQNKNLLITPASCLDCDFVFQKRGRLTRPGKCPVCRSTHLSEPLFSLQQ